ncbi:MAG: hypothetical protein J6Z45_00695, partial [Oscillospiraceae bacterium]|nr:hypothetical protein [Oscillospiraceae bacterium]
MTICPKCGKEYRITPDVCGECGTPLAASEIADPFAEAVREEEKLRAKARERLAQQPAQEETAQFSEEPDASDVITRAAEEVKPGRKKLRTAAVAAAFAVAAGGGWLGWRHFRGAQSPAGMDIRFFDGNQPCFYDGSTGTVHQIGNPIDPEATDLGSDWKETFWQEFQISADRSCVFYPEYLASGSSYVSNGFIPCRLELKEQNGSKGKNGRLTDGMEEFAGTDGTVAYYEVMDNFGDKVLMIRYMEDPETSGRLDTQYVVWQNEERYGTGGGILEGSDSPVLDGLSLPMTDNQDGSYLSLSSQVLPFGTEADQPVLAIPGVFNAGECFRIDLMRKDGTLEKNICTAGINLQIETPWDFEGPREGNSARYFKPRYLFYEALEETDHFERPERDFTLVGDGYELLVREDESIVQLHIREGTDSLTQEELAQKAQELMNRSRFAVVSGVHRLDRVTGEDVLILTGNSEWTVWKTLGTGSLLKIEALDPDMNEYAYHLCSIENGEMTEKTLLTTEDETEKYTFVAGICGRDDMYYYANEESRSYLALNGQIHELLIAASEKDDVIYDDPDHRVHSLILSDCSLSKSGDRALLRLEGRYYLCDLSGLGPD